MKELIHFLLVAQFFYSIFVSNFFFSKSGTVQIVNVPS